jgi:hypothetical protein
MSCPQRRVRVGHTVNVRYRSGTTFSIQYHRMGTDQEHGEAVLSHPTVSGLSHSQSGLPFRR